MKSRPFSEVDRCLPWKTAFVSVYRCCGFWETELASSGCFHVWTENGQDAALGRAAAYILRNSDPVNVVMVYPKG